MKSRRGLFAFLTVALLVLGVSTFSLRADEGFWPFTSVPKVAIKARYGFNVTDEWLTHLQLASVRFGSASGSFVSPDGLVLTNHHVGLSTLSKLSTPERDLAKHGFYARTRAEELKAPDLELNVLTSIDDMTARVNAAVKPDMSPAAAFAARRAAIAGIEKESLVATGLKSEIVTLYQGGQYHLYRYKKYTDVRLVFAPEFDIAFFGGDPDNFTYPRYSLDVALFRVYEDDKPIRADHYLKWSPQGARNGELVFTSGHPGATQRLNTVAHLEYLRDTGLPAALKSLERRQALLKQYGARGEEQARQAKDELFSVENSLKSLRGQLQGLRDEALMTKKRDAERRLIQAIGSDPQKQAMYGDAWEAIARARKGLPGYDVDRNFLEGAAGFGTRFFPVARALLRLAMESGKPDADRLPEFTDARRASLERQLFSPAPIYAEFEQVKLADSLAFMNEELGTEHPVVRTALNGKTHEARAAELIGGTRLADLTVRKELAAGGAAAIERSTDAMIALAKAVDAEARAVRKRYEDEVVSVERLAYAKIAQAVFALEGAGAYPDGTSTLRLSYGAIKGYEDAGTRVAPFTELAGLYNRAEEHRNRPPYLPPPTWRDKKSALDLKTPYNLVSTNDIVGGNSGSPLVNRNGEIVGLIFDGNIESLPGYFVYAEAVNRAVSVDVRAIIEALRKVYGAPALADELLGKRPAQTSP